MRSEMFKYKEFKRLAADKEKRKVLITLIIMFILFISYLTAKWKMG